MPGGWAGRSSRGLLAGSPAERDVLGLMAAARGGLSCADLSELAGVPLWEVEEIVHTVAGRTFARRPRRWTQGEGPEVYLLGHEELQAAAVGYLAGQLPGCRERLHAWAEAWRARGWPPGTPEYLLSGYYQLLASLGDLSRMAACALDRLRHDRMLVATGGDGAALAEVRAALDLSAAQESPDLGSALALACRRDRIVDRNASMPAELPAVWAALGQVTRAEALAASITDLRQRAEALARVAVALNAAGRHEQAAAVAGQAEAAARSVTTYSPGWRKALAEVARVLAAAQRGEAPALTRTAVALAEEVGTGGRGWGIEGSSRPTAEERQAFQLAQDAEVLAVAGRHEEAAVVAGQVQVLAASATCPGKLAALALADAARALAAAGRHEQAAVVAEQAETVACSIDYPQNRAGALARVARALAAAGRCEQAEAIARSITNPDDQGYALADVARALAAAGRCEQAEAIARSITDPAMQGLALAGVVRRLAAAGWREQAEAIARSITNPSLQARALADIAKALAAAGLHEQAEAVAGQAEAAARSITDLDGQEYALAGVTRTLAAAGWREQAEAIAHSITNPSLQARALADTAEALVAAGLHQEAAAIARSITDPDQQANALARVAEALASTGDTQSATRIAATACTAGQWTTAAIPVLLLDPLAFTVIAHVLDER